MSAIFFLIACSVLLALTFLIAFFWAHQSGQNDDLYTPSVRILFDDLQEISDESALDEKADANQLR